MAPAGFSLDSSTAPAENRRTGSLKGYFTALKLIMRIENLRFRHLSVLFVFPVEFQIFVILLNLPGDR